MQKYIAKLQVRLNEDRGATAVEYGLLVTLIALAIVAGAGALGDSIDDLFNDASTYLNGVPRP